MRLDSPTGTLAGFIDVPDTGGWQTWQTVETTLGAVNGTHNIYLVFERTDGSGGGGMLNLNWFSLGLPAGPAILTATAATVSPIDLSRDAVPGATAYHLKRSTISGGPYTTVDSGIASTSYSDTPVFGGVRYYYTVTAVYSGNESDASPESSAVPSDPITSEDLLYEPLGVMSSGSGDVFALSFPDSGRGWHYQVQTSETMQDTDWQNAGGVVPGNGGMLQIEFPYVPGLDRWFYRVAIWRQ